MKKLMVITLIVLSCANTYGQGDSLLRVGMNDQSGMMDMSPIVMAAGHQYKASGWKELWWGKHYRKEWTTPVSFPVLDLSAIDGGLKPIKVGGGHQTKSLRLLSVNGKEYVLRTMDKNLDVLVPDDFKGTFINDIVNDQISTAHPYGPIAIAAMAASLSFIHTNPKIYYVPDDPDLEDFRNIFVNKLCLLEERPSGKGWERSAFFGNADNIVNSEKMLDKVIESSKSHVDQRSYLNIRFFDLIVNDWDRHEDQWVWAVKKINNRNIYTPIARDRDQAFSKTDGISMYILSRPWALRALQSMHSHNRDLRGSTLSSRNLDRQFLNQLTKDEWKQSVEFIQTNLTDSSIRSAIETMPAEVNKFSGAFLIHRLIQRRDNLMKDGMRFYSIVNKQVVINGSAENEQFIIQQERKNEVSVTALRAQGDTFYHRVFNRFETKEINIYGLDGNDQYIVNAKSKNRFKIRLIGGDGENHYTVTEKSFGGNRYRIYDSLLHKKITNNVFRANRKWDTLYRYNRVSVKHDWYVPLVVPGYNPDDGFSIGLGLLYKKQQWGKTPFGWQQSLTIDYATGTQAVGFGYQGLFKQTFGKWDLDVTSFYKGPRFTFNYYGFGNETELKGYSRSYFRVKGNDFFLSPGISRTWKLHYLRLGLQYENVEILRSQNKFITSPEAGIPSVFSSKHFAGVNGQWTFSNAGDEKNVKEGVQLTGGFSFLNNLNNSSSRMLKLNGAVSFHHTFFRRLILAHRTGAGTIFGDYEFYQANTLGSDQNLRGFWRSRFAGKSNFYQNTDLRLIMFNLRGYVVRGEFGVFGFFDDGRVWIKGEHSSKIHTGYGGGIFLVPYKLAVLSLYYAKSNEANTVTLRTGVFF